MAKPLASKARRKLFHLTYKLSLIGFLGNNAEVRTNNDRSLTIFSIATKSSYKKDGKYIEHTEWTLCVAFGKLGEYAREAHARVREQEDRHDRVRDRASRQRDPRSESYGQHSAIAKTIAILKREIGSRSMARLVFTSSRDRDPAHRDTRDPMAAKGLLRHSSVNTTLAHYIKEVPEVTANGMAQVEQLFTKLHLTGQAVQ
jgi:hypothetical protein